MSPASAGALEVERYIGACLISQNRSKKPLKNGEFFQRAQVFPRNGYVNLQGCPPADGWAGGVPLISFARHPRRGNLQEHEDIPPNHHLARLAVHTQGAPLILTKSYNHRKSKPQRHNYNNNVNVQQTKVFENSNKKLNKIQESGNVNVKGVDAISVTSDESSGSQNLDTCLPRIIKPRKRRKKDRKPPHLTRSQNQDSFSIDGDNQDFEAVSFASLSPFLSYFEPISYQQPVVDDNKPLLDLLNDISETPKLHHTFEDVEEVKDVNGNQPASTCQCRYCDPEGQIWDVDRNCYSPFLTPPKAFQFPSLFSSFPPQTSDDSLVHSFSSMSLVEDKYKPSYSRSSSSSLNSSSSSTGDLEVSTEIVTSLNGHRDLEIKFWLNSAVDNKSTKKSECDTT
ncbi:uncharacterized protein LOC115884744 [Sitophilus oryzae]|uniref:Uncharacterized protein LOC115884744 n=1 Tax=Sitophilus oryzae TaxID=7048 RepID=A0A6J2Y816_SITOR|nr:uncharacterized protein LOC115884744 [Sitophilus oryzae]